MSVYGDIILDHYHYPRNFKALEKPTASVDVDNPLCGDKLHFEIVEHDDLIESVGFTGEGCAVSLASASMLTEHVKGKSIDVLRSLTPEFVVGLLQVELSPNRLKCALLAWEGLQKLTNNT